MKRTLILCFAAMLLFCAGTIRAQELTQADKTLAYLESTKAGVLASVKGLSPAQLNFKPAPDRWSVAECLEHIASAEDFIRGLITEKVMTSPAVPGPYRRAEDPPPAQAA